MATAVQQSWKPDSQPRYGSAKKKSITISYVPEPRTNKQHKAMYSGLNNMSLKWERPKSTWRSKSPDKGTGQSKKDGKGDTRGSKKGKEKNAKSEGNDTNNEKEDECQNPRRQRSANIMKFRYPQHFHQTYDPNERLVMERNVPECVRHHAPKYGFLPMRLRCSYNPWASVTFMKSHELKSFPLPHPLDDSNGKSRPESAGGATKSVPADLVHNGDDHEEEQDLNGTYSFVHDNQEEEKNHLYDNAEGPQFADDYTNGNEEEDEKERADTDRGGEEQERSEAEGGYSSDEPDDDDNDDAVDDETGAPTPRKSPDRFRDEEEETSEVESEDE